MGETMRNFKFLLVLVAAVILFSGLANAQGLASLTGTVIDSSGAAVSGAAVKLTNTRTGAVYSTKTASDGSYRLVDLPPGPAYNLAIKKDGFQTFEAANLYLPVATTTTQGAKLEVGSVTQTVHVTESGSVSLDTTDTTIGNNLDMRAVESLPNEFRDDPGQLLRLQVGTVSAQSGQGQAVTSHEDPNNTRDGSVAGARADQNNINVDGIDATDFAAGMSFQSQAAIPVDAVQEFSTQVAQPSAAFGGRSGAQTVISTKSGTNDWHGSAYEYNRTAATEANTFFNNQNGVPRLALVRNQFGGNVGGPVLKDKLFFFFEYDGRRDASAQSETQFVPFPHVQNGEIAYINNSGGSSCSDNSRLTSADVSTNCVTIAPAAEVTGFDPCATASCSGAQGFAAAGPAPALLGLFKTRYPAPNDFNVGDGLNTAGLLFNAPAPLTENGYVSRVDYNLSANNKLFGRFNLRNLQTVNNTNGNLAIQFPGDPLTALATIRDRAWVVGDTWTIGPNLINQFTVGETRANDQLPITNNPAGGFYELSFFGSFGGSTFATPYERQTAQGHVVPEPTLRDDVTFIRGKHTFQFGGQFNPVKVRSGLTNDFTFVQEGLGGAITGLSPALRPSDILADNAAESEWDNFFVGDLGIINNVQAAINYDAGGNPLPAGSSANRDWRIYETAGYFQDSWKIRNDLTFTAGVRYQYQSAPYEVHGVDAQFFNTNLDNIVETRVANGLAGISGPDATPLLTYQRSGAGNPGGKPLYAPEKHDFSPRIGLAWNPSFNDGLLGHVFGDRKTVVRAGADLLYDESVIYAITNLENQSNYLFGNTVADEFNSGATTTFALENDPRFNSASSAPFAITPPPFQNPLTPAAIFNDGIDPHLHTPYSYSVSFGLQRELPGGFQLEADYYGRFGRRLLMLGDASQAMDFTDPASKQTLVQAFSTLELDSRQNAGAGVPVASITPQPFFENQMNAALAADGAGTCATFYTFASGVTPSCTAAVYKNNFQALQQGGTGGILPALPLPQNVGLTPQFFVNALMANEGFSDYNSLFVTLRKRLSHNLQFDFNYTYSHSIDNGSTVSLENGNFQQGVTSVMCDVTNDSACRGNSEFDATHQISAEFVYDLPFGRGQTFGRDSGWFLNEVIGGWQVSGIPTWRSGLAFTANGTDIAQFDTVSLAADTGALFTGTKSAVSSSIHIDAANNNEVQFFANQANAAAAFSPVTGLQSGSRDTLRGPHFSNLDLAVSKNFPLLSERYRLQFRAEAYNAFNHPNFGIPDTGVTSGRFGVISGLAGQESSRVMQFALRFDF
jgi:Carboxypeptidase regulatory-like domain/TonB dependent receptor